MVCRQEMSTNAARYARTTVFLHRVFVRMPVCYYFILTCMILTPSIYADEPPDELGVAPMCLLLDVILGLSIIAFEPWLSVKKYLLACNSAPYPIHPEKYQYERYPCGAFGCPTMPSANKSVDMKGIKCFNTLLIQTPASRRY